MGVSHIKFKIVDDQRISKENIEHMDGYRSKIKGTYLTRELFIELADPRLKGNKPLYTLCTRDKGEYKSLYQIYMDSSDDYEFAMTAFKSWGQFQYLLSKEWFRKPYAKIGFPGFDCWVAEKKAKEVSVLNTWLKAKAAEGNVIAMKTLKDGLVEKNPVGRPRKPQENLNEEDKKMLEDLNKGLARARNDKQA
jgi:hypothetical protein